jgi:ribosomal protein S13
MAEGSGEHDLPMLGKQDPSSYTRKSSKVRFALAKFHGLGSDGSWTVSEIAEALEVHPRTVSKYLNETEMADEVKSVLAVTEAEWRLDMALDLRREVKRLEQIEQELLQRRKTVATGFETKTVTGTPTGDRNIRLPDDADEYELKMPVPVDYEEVTDYGQDLSEVQTQKRQYWDQIADLLGLDEADKRAADEALVEKADEVKIVEVRETDDPYPETEPLDMDQADADDVVEVDSTVEDTEEASDAD